MADDANANATSAILVPGHPLMGEVATRMQVLKMGLESGL